MNNFIIKLLDLKEEDIEDISIIEELGIHYFNVTLKRKEHSCPRCFKMTMKVKDYRIKKLSHQVYKHLDTVISYNRRRYLCPYCGKVFIENCTFGHTYSSISTSVLLAILKDLKHYTATYSNIAAQYNISPSTVIKIFDNHVQIKRHTLQKVLCIDEFYFNRRSKHKYAFMIMGFKNNLIIDIIESRKHKELSSYFFTIPIAERRAVTHICMDMYSPYKYIVTTYFPNAILCIDSFHVIKKISDSLNSLRKRIGRKYIENKDSKEYKLLKYKYKLLLMKSENINNEEYYFDRTLGYTTTQAGVLEEIFNIDDRLRIAYNLREEYRAFNSIKEKDFKKEEHQIILNTLIDAFKHSNIKEMKEVGKTLTNWKREVLNSFVWFDNRRLSNGPIEGKNSYIKKIIANANGLTNFARARNKFMYSQNKHESYTISVEGKKIKTSGKTRGKYKKQII